MMLKNICNPRGFLLLSLCIILMFNVKSYDFTEVDYAESLGVSQMENVDAGRSSVTTKRSGSMAIPKLGDKFSVLKALTIIVSVVAVSAILIKCVRSLKKGSGTTSRRLAGGDNCDTDEDEDARREREEEEAARLREQEQEATRQREADAAREREREQERERQRQVEQEQRGAPGDVRQRPGHNANTDPFTGQPRRQGRGQPGRGQVGRLQAMMNALRGFAAHVDPRAAVPAVQAIWALIRQRAQRDGDEDEEVQRRQPKGAKAKAKAFAGWTAAQLRRAAIAVVQGVHWLIRKIFNLVQAQPEGPRRRGLLHRAHIINPQNQLNRRGQFVVAAAIAFVLHFILHWSWNYFDIPFPLP